MEHAGRDSLPHFDLTDLAALTLEEGPFFTVVAARPDVGAPVASRRTELHRLVEGQLPDDTIDQLAEIVDAEPSDGSGVIAIASPEGVLVSEPLPDAPRRELSRLGPLPSLAPLIAHRQSQISTVLVVTDREGADVFWSGDTEGATTIDAADGPISKIAAGGWSQRRYQQRAENTWELTAIEVADDLVTIVRRVRPQVITVAGDVRMVQLLGEHLPNDVAGLLRDVPGGRSEDGSDERRAEEIRRWVRTSVAEDTVAVLQTFERERGQHDRAADGPAASFTALRAGQVEMLLVHDDPDDDRQAWFVTDAPMMASEDRATLEQLGLDEPRSARLIDVAIRAALGGGADVRVVPGEGPLNDGIGAILRW